MRLFAASLLLSALATPALAQDNTDKPFEGASITAITGVDRAGALDANGTGVIYGGQLGYDIQSGKAVFGVEGEVSGASTKYCTTNTSPGTYCDKAGRDLYVGGRLGYVVSPTTMVYVKAGYTNARDKFTYRDSVTPANDYSASGNQDGIRGGVGVETRIGKNLTAKAEYRYSNYADSSYSRNQGVVGLGFHF